MKATNNILQIKEKDSKKGFQVTQENLAEGEIVSIGDLVSKDFPHFKKGDIVLFDKHKAMQYPIKGINYMFLEAKTILAK